MQDVAGQKTQYRMSLCWLSQVKKNLVQDVLILAVAGQKIPAQDVLMQIILAQGGGVLLQCPGMVQQSQCWYNSSVHRMPTAGRLSAGLPSAQCLMKDIPVCCPSVGCHSDICPFIGRPSRAHTRVRCPVIGNHAAGCHREAIHNVKGPISGHHTTGCPRAGGRLARSRV